MYGGSIAGGSSSCRRVGGNVSWIEELLGRMADDSRRRCALGQSEGACVWANLAGLWLQANVKPSRAFPWYCSLLLLLLLLLLRVIVAMLLSACMQRLKRVRCG